VDRAIRQVRGRRPDLPEWAVGAAARAHIASLREVFSRGEIESDDARLEPSAVVEAVETAARRLAAPHPRPVINATGVLLHTNLGRAPLAEAAARAVDRALDGYSSLELDLETGRRGSRMGQLEAKLVALSGAEAAHVVNNNAAAVLLALNTLALGRTAIVSRGELVEIGGSFRVPAIMERAGVQLCEVGTTNRTHLADYERAIDEQPDAGLLLKVHRSNFEQRGFVAEADVRALAALARARGLPLVEDLGSGTLLDLRETGLPEESFVPGRLALGLDVVCFSGDKLLGGPQAGILLGRAPLIDAMRRNPLARALRVDKLTVAALDATLDLMLDPGRADEIPIVAGLRAGPAALEERAQRLERVVTQVLAASGNAAAAGSGWKVRVAPSEVAVGGGSVPEHRRAGRAVVLEGGSATRLAAALRRAAPPVLARVRDDALWLDVGTLRERDLEHVGAALALALDAP
jgi:L-seryl-tRNA(Ser) seleniumtransferase